MKLETEQEFIEFVNKSERDARANPTTYKFKLGLFACLGYVVIFLVLLSLLSLAGGIVAAAIFSTALLLLLIKKKIIFLILFGIWVLARALWVRFEAPTGHTLSRKKFPILYQELDSLSKELNALKIHKVILDESLNAGVLQHPRLGVLGWQKNYLILGYQLLLTLSPDEARSVLAHEFGHLSSNHSKFSGWIYRIRLTWARVMAAFEQTESIGGQLLQRFFNWYAPRFQAYSFALARSNEYEADAIASELTSPETASAALVNIHAKAPYVDQKYWKFFFEQADTSASPPHMPFDGLAKFIREQNPDSKEMQDRIAKEMEIKTSYSDTHPSLKDRIDALGVSNCSPKVHDTNAADAWLGDEHEKLVRELDQEWLAANKDSWVKRYNYSLDAKKSLKTFHDSDLDSLSDDDLWNFAFWTYEFESLETSIPIFKRYQDRHTNDPDSAYYIGWHLYEDKDPACICQFEIAIKSPDLIEQAANAGYDYLKENESKEAAEAWWERCVQQYETILLAERERSEVTDKDVLLEHELTDHQFEHLQEVIGNHKSIRQAWVARKQLEHFPENPLFVIAIQPKGISVSHDSLLRKIFADAALPNNFVLVMKAGKYKSLAKKVIKAGEKIKYEQNKAL